MHSTNLRFPGREPEAGNRSIIFRKSGKTDQLDEFVSHYFQVKLHAGLGQILLKCIQDTDTDT